MIATLCLAVLILVAAALPACSEPEKARKPLSHPQTASKDPAGRAEAKATPSSDATPDSSPAPDAPRPPEPSPVAGAAPESTSGSRTLVVEVHPSDRSLKSGKITARLGGEANNPPTDIPATLWLVYPDAVINTPPIPDPIAKRVAQWFGPRPHYRAVRVSAATIPDNLPPESGYFAEFTLPEHTDAIQAFVDGEPVALLQSPKRSLPPAPHADTTAARAALAILGADPRDHWRTALITPEAPDLLPTDPIIRGLVQRSALAARAAVASLEPDLAGRTSLRLTGIVDLGDGVSLPIWPNDPAPARDLIDQLLNPATPPNRKAMAAQAWLDQQPTAGAVVIDDAAAIDPRPSGVGTGGITLPSVLLVNFSDLPAAASATRAEVPPLDMLRIEPLSAITATIGADRRPDESSGAAARAATTDTRRLDTNRRTLADIRIGSWRAKRSVIGEIARIGPPGLKLGPLMADWNQATFLAAATDTTAFGPMPESPVAGSVTGRLYKTGDAAGRWTFYFEIASEQRRVRPGASPTDAYELVLYFGPRNGSTSLALQIKPDGTLTEIRDGKSTPGGKATVVRAADHASLFIPLPSTAIEAGHILRVGMVFIDAQGTRSAWPRPMLPWDAEPGRIAVDLDTWSLP